MTAKEYTATIKQLKNDINRLESKINTLKSELVKATPTERHKANKNILIYQSWLTDTRIQLAHFINI